MNLRRLSPLTERLLGPLPAPAQAVRIAANAWRADRALMVFTLGWLGYTALAFPEIAGRPEALYRPAHWFGHLFLPVQMPAWLTLPAAALAVALAAGVLWRPGRAGFRIALLFLLMWLNLVRWSYGFTTHLNHVFLLAHFLFIFLPIRRCYPLAEAQEAYRGWQWLAFGVLATYSWAGVWKAGSTAFKILKGVSDLTWFSPESTYYNAIVSYRTVDIPFSELPDWLGPGWQWSAAFALALCLQLFAVVGALRLRLLPWVSFAMALFHVGMAVLFRIEFWTAAIVLVLLFFPYHYFFRPAVAQPVVR